MSPVDPFTNMDESHSTWVSNHMPNKVWDEISYPFPNFRVQGLHCWSLGIDITSHNLLVMWLLIDAGIQVNPSQ